MSNDLSLRTLRAANAARDLEWDPENKANLLFRAAELGGEVGEALNIMKKLARERLGMRGSRATKEQLAEELADVVICADLSAMEEGIDLAVAVRSKFNATSSAQKLGTFLSGDAPPAQEKVGNALFLIFKSGGKYYTEARGTLPRFVFEPYFEPQKARIMITSANGGCMPGLSGKGDEFIVVVNMDEEVDFGWPLVLLPQV